jgi:hypothetical protein
MRLILWLAILGFLVALMGHAYSEECQSGTDGRSYWTWRYVDGHRCWYRGHRVLPKSRLHWKTDRLPTNAKVIVVPDGVRAEASPKITAPEIANEIDLLSDKTPYADVIEDRPFGPWEERIGGQW